MKSIIQFTISQSEGIYIAEGVNLAIVTDAPTLDDLVVNISDAVELYFKDENPEDLEFKPNPSILLNYEIPQYA